MKGEKANKLNQLGPDKILKLYQEHGDLTKTAKYLDMNLETLRKFFIKNNIPYQKFVTYNLNHNFFSEINERSMYWAGFIASDGNVDKIKPRVTIGLKTTDKNHLEKLKSDLNFEGPIIDTVTEDNRPGFKSKYYYKSTIKFTSRQVIKNLYNTWGITPNKSKILKFPEHLKDHPLIHHFIRGLIDGDGSVCYKDNDSKFEYYIFLCGTENIVKNVENILKEQCGAKGKFYVNKNKLNNIIYKKIKHLQNIINYLYNGANVYLDRKYLAAQQISTLTPRKIDINIEEAVKLLNEGILIKDIAKSMGCSYCTVRRRLIEHNKIIATKRQTLPATDQSP